MLHKIIKENISEKIEDTIITENKIKIRDM